MKTYDNVTGSILNNLHALYVSGLDWCNLYVYVLHVDVLCSSKVRH